MIKLFLAGIIAGILIIVSCSKDNTEANDCTYDCKSLYFTENSSRSDSKTLKGHILFSWKNNINSWNYSIVPNLNISPAHENISEGNSITGEECLKKNLAHFAEGEEFYWTLYPNNIVTKEGKTINLSYPPDNYIHDIQVFCDSLKIKLVLEY